MLAILIFGVIKGLLISIMGLAFQFNYKGLKIFDASLAGVYLITPYIFITIDNSFISSNFLTSLITILLTITISITYSLVIFRLIYLPFLKKNSGSITMFIISILIFTITINLVVLFFNSDVITVVIENKNLTEPNSFLGVNITAIQIVQFLTCLFLAVVFMIFMTRSVIWTKIRAIFENEQLYSILGFNTNKARIIILSISSILVSIVSLLMSIDVGINPYETSFNFFLLGVLASIIGGVHSIYGFIIGGMFVGITMNFCAWIFPGHWGESIVYILLIIGLILRKKSLQKTIRTFNS